MSAEIRPSFRVGLEMHKELHQENCKEHQMGKKAQVENQIKMRSYLRLPNTILHENVSDVPLTYSIGLRIFAIVAHALGISG